MRVTDRGMAYTEEDLQSLNARIEAALTRGTLGSWETRFLQDIQAKIRKDGTNVRLSDKQARKLNEVVNRSVSPAPYRLPQFRKRYPRKRRSFFAREARYFGFRLRRDLTIAALLLIVLGLHQLYRDFAPLVSLPVGTPSNNVSTGAPQPTTISGDIRVIDGDTVDVRGEHFRLIGLNTPETFEPRCDQEFALGTKAKERLRELLATGAATLTKMPCSCPPGTEGTSKCNFGRSCGVLVINGRDVASTLVAEGLAVEFHCGSTSCPPLPRPWCN